MDELRLRRERRTDAPREHPAAARGEQHDCEQRHGGEQSHDREQQARRYAEHAERKESRRRAEESGVTGWVADRAGEWDLSGPHWGFMEAQKFLWNPLMDYWFRMEMDGWEKLPPPPALLIGIHSGAPLPWDAWTMGMQWWRRFGSSRPLHGTAHDALMAMPILGAYFRRMGVLPAAADSITAALAADRDVILFPGGERDSLRHWARRDDAVLAGRMGFVKLAIRCGVPIVPVATVGGPDSMPVLATGRRLARALQLDRVARIKMFPIALQAPWGLSPALLPELPLPTKIRTAFQEPIELDPDPARAEDNQYVGQMYRRVSGSIQDGMDALARRRRLPLFG